MILFYLICKSKTSGLYEFVPFSNKVGLNILFLQNNEGHIDLDLLDKS